MEWLCQQEEGRKVLQIAIVFPKIVIVYTNLKIDVILSFKFFLRMLHFHRKVILLSHHNFKICGSGPRVFEAWIEVFIISPINSLGKSQRLLEEAGVGRLVTAAPVVERDSF